MSVISFFNIKDGYLEALCRGMRSGFLTHDDYKRLALCENLHDMRSVLEDTDYGNFLQDEPSPLSVDVITDKARRRLAREFKHLRSQANEPLGSFLDLIAAEKMIDNVMLLIQGTINKKATESLLENLDPMGIFPEIAVIATMDLSASYDELYKTLLIDTPVAPYFEKYLETTQSFEGNANRSIEEVANIFGETDIELMRNTVKKAWLEEFHEFVQTLGGTSTAVMDHILKCEGDFRVLLVTLNSINTVLGGSSQLQDRNALYPSFGYLYPEGTDRIRKAWNDATVRAALDPFPKYLNLYEQCKMFYMKEGDGIIGSSIELPSMSGGENSSFEGVSSPDYSHAKSLEDLLYAENVVLCELAFEQQFNYGVFYAYVKLKEQEIRNLMWIANMILMNRKEHIRNIVPIFASRLNPPN